MGVVKLMPFLQKNAPGCIKVVSVKHLKGMRIGIDASISIYSWTSIGASRGIVNSSGSPIHHIQASLYNAVSMITAGMNPVYIFDGKPPAAKAKTIASRRAARGTKSNGSTSNAMRECAYLFELLGVPIVYAKGEAEVLGAQLTKIGKLDAFATNDTDSIVLGAIKTIRGLTRTAKTVQIIEYDNVLDNLGLTSSQFLDMCIMMGTDYTIPMRPVQLRRKTPYNLIRAHNDIEGISAEYGVNLSSYNYTTARHVYTTAPYVPEVDLTLRRLTHNDIEHLQHYLINIHRLEQNRITKTLANLASYYKIE
jgi:flap endonuclease-1